MKKYYCDNCDCEQEVEEFDVEEQECFDNVSFTYTRHNLVCKHCHEEVYDYENEKKNSIAKADAYRKLVGLLTSEEIKEIRTRYHCSQTECQQYVANTFKDTDDKSKKLQSYGSDSQSSDLNCMILSENDIQNIVLLENESKKKFEIKFNSWYDRYCSILSRGTDNCDELVDQLNNDQEDFFFDDFLMKFIVKAPVHLREVFIDDLLIGNINIFNKSYKNMLVECSKLPFKTLAKKAYNILRLHSEEFDSL